VSSYGGLVKTKKFGLAVLAGILLEGASAALGSTVQVDMSVPKDLLFRTAKIYLLKQSQESTLSPDQIIRLEDASSGILRFRFQEGKFSDDGALIEVIDLDPEHSRLRVTIPTDFGGRGEMLVDEISQTAKRIEEGKEGKEIRYGAKGVFQSVRRYVLKRFVRENPRKDQVIRLEDEGVGLLGFTYSEDGFVDSKASVQVVPMGDRLCRIIVSLPKDPSLRQQVLEKELRQAISDDLAESRSKESRR
jgi:hypothetical protein